MKKWVGLCLAIVLLWGIAFPSAYALSCAPPRPPKEEMDYSELVFKGRLLSETKEKLTFQVLTVWKGDLHETVTLNQNHWTEFEAGEEYIIFAGRDEGKLRPKLCGNTGLASSFDETTLGETSVVISKSNGGLQIVLVVIAGLAVIAGAGIILFKSIGASKR